MSSNESDHEEAWCDCHLETHNPRYLVLTPKWRAQCLSDWLHVFDSLYMVDHQSDGPSHSDFPHLRIHNAENPHFSDHPARPVPGLLKNAYDPTWLASCSNFRVGCKDYSFMHENSLFSWAPPLLTYSSLFLSSLLCTMTLWYTCVCIVHITILSSTIHQVSHMYICYMPYANYNYAEKLCQRKSYCVIQHWLSTSTNII